MSPERLAYFSECVRRHTNIVPSLAAEALAHIQAQVAVVERLSTTLATIVQRNHTADETGCHMWSSFENCEVASCSEAAAALRETTP